MATAILTYKESLSQDGKSMRKFEIVEIDVNADQAGKYQRLYELQTPIDDRSRVFFRTTSIAID